MPSKTNYIGYDALSKLGILSLSYPINDNGNIDDFDDMNLIWISLFNQLILSKSINYSIVITDMPDNTQNLDNRQNIITNLFDYSFISNVYVISRPILTAYNNNLPNGIMIDFDVGQLFIVPIRNGLIVEDAIRSVRINGI